MRTNGSTFFDITVYQPTSFDDELYNPMFKEVREIIDRFAVGGVERARNLLAMERQSLIEHYAFAIPTAETLCTVAQYAPIVEIGAGSGYWAKCLTSCGADVIAYDRYPAGERDSHSISERNWHFSETWFSVQKGDELSAATNSARSLFLCWPPPENPMAFRALDCYIKAGGHTVIVIGSMNPIAMGDSAFYTLLQGLTMLERRRIHGWPGFTEELLICSCQ